jgi:hypothetical protein
MRLAGVDWLTVARKLAADPAINTDRIAYPQGYGIERYRKGQEPTTDTQLIQAACKDVREALKERRSELDDKADDLREIENARLDRLFFVAYRQAVKEGNLAAIDRALRIMERRARLLGLDRPQKTELTGADGAAIEITTTTALDELEALIGISEEAARGTQ